jgi:hypothetical protein
MMMLLLRALFIPFGRLRGLGDRGSIGDLM